MLDYFQSLDSQTALTALAILESYEGYDAKGNDVRNHSLEFVRRVEDIFDYIDSAISERNADGYITTEDLITFFGETCAKGDAKKEARYWLKEIDGHGETDGYINLDEMLNYLDTLSPDEAVEALESLEAYEGYDAPATAAAPVAAAAKSASDDVPIKKDWNPFLKRVTALFNYIDESIGKDGKITAKKLITFFGETCAKGEAENEAVYWLKQIDGHGQKKGKNDGCLTAHEMMDYFQSLDSKTALAALETLESFEGYDAKGNDVRNHSPEFVRRVEDLFTYIDSAISERNADGYITTEDLITFFGETCAKGESKREARSWLKEMDSYGETDGYINLDEMLNYFDTLSPEVAVEALESLEAHEGYVDGSLTMVI